MTPFSFIHTDRSRKRSPRVAVPDAPRMLYDATLARSFADGIVSVLRSSFVLGKVSIAGSLRRGHAQVHDIDILLGLPDPAFMSDRERWVHILGPRTLGAVSPLKVSVIAPDGCHADIRVVPLASWGSALQYYTGSRGHNVWLRTLANKRGLSLSEYGFRPLVDGRWGDLEPIARESEVYTRLGLRWMPPRYRERPSEVRPEVPH